MAFALLCLQRRERDGEEEEEAEKEVRVSEFRQLLQNHRAAGIKSNFMFHPEVEVAFTNRSEGCSNSRLHYRSD